jgi:acyl-lipid omega-6 desaturase (Delta-12 desaturase)
LNFINHSVFTHELRQHVIKLNAHCNRYREADNYRGAWEFAITVICLGVLYAAIWMVMPYSTVAALLFAIPNGIFLTRIFAIQHDCGHGSFLTSRKANDWLGRCISLLTLTPYDHWRRSHAYHHANSGNLEGRGLGDIETITVAEFRALSPGGQWRYRVMRNPLVALGLGPILYFFVLQRGAIKSYGESLPLMDRLKSILALDLALVAFYGALAWFMGFANAALLVVPSIFVAAWIGGWLFYVQHQFEHTHWDQGDEWDVKVAALKGSSYLVLPTWMNWLTCNIAMHHVHHLVSRIPSYRLPECLAASHDLQVIAPRLSLWQALRTSHLALWDETTRRLISFKEHDRLKVEPAA